MIESTDRRADFRGKVAVVTGGASGIGAASCQLLAARGAKVAVLDIDTDRAIQVASELPDAVALECDVADSAAVDDAFARLVKSHGWIDVVVNSAGPQGDATKVRSLTAQGEKAGDSGVWAIQDEPETTATLNLTDAEWLREFQVVLFGVFHTTRAALRTMIPRHQGAIVSLSSIHGVAGGVGLPHYSAAKAGVLGFTRSVAKEVAPFGVRINAIASGYVDTPILRRLMPPAMQASVAGQTPMGRLGRADELAATVCFLASAESSFMTGQTLSPNGGWLTV
jgi:3-oxoacyl-[acyl-carrier protein] reductase